MYEGFHLISENPREKLRNWTRARVFQVEFSKRIGTLPRMCESRPTDFILNIGTFWVLQMYYFLGTPPAI
jgi:hypothetical protein